MIGNGVQQRAADTALYGLMLMSLVILLFPVAWMISTALKTPGQVFVVPPVWIPTDVSTHAFAYAFQTSIMIFFKNSVIVAAGSALVTTTAGALTAYGISRLQFRGTNLVLIGLLASLAFPIPLIMITMYTTFLHLAILDTLVALIIGHSVITLPVVVWLLKGFFDSLPVEVEESALIDGASPLRTLFSIVLPMTRPGIAAAAIFVFVTSWNEFVLGLTFTSSTNMRPLPAGISLVFLQEFQYQWPEMMAVAIVATVPILALFAFFQRSFIEGVTAGAVKG